MRVIASLFVICLLAGASFDNNRSTAWTRGPTPPSLRNNSAALIRCFTTQCGGAGELCHGTSQADRGLSASGKNKEVVRLALDWALYRMADRKRFIASSRNDSGRQTRRSVTSRSESLDLLYPFLRRQTNVPDRINAGLLKALARIGDAQTLELVVVS